MLAAEYLRIFFRKWDFIFQKIGKNKENGKHSDRYKNEAGVVYSLTYIFSDFIVDVLKNLNFAQF